MPHRISVKALMAEDVALRLMWHPGTMAYVAKYTGAPNPGGLMAHDGRY